MAACGVSRQFHAMDDHQLDQIIRTIKGTRPQVGVRYLVGHLRARGLRIQIHRVVRSLRRVDPVGFVLRRRMAIKRRQYRVKRPNSVWHLDGHHKLIAWGVVIHGMIDGYSRLVRQILRFTKTIFINYFKVTGLRASTNNKASTVFDLFLQAIKQYDCPSRVRGDRGGENIIVSIYMIMRRGPNRGSFLWGS